MLENVLDNLDVGICIFDDKGTFLFVNRTLLKFSGRSRKDYLGKTVYDFYRQGIIDRCIVDSVYQTKKPVTHLQTSYSSRGEARERLVTVSPVFDSYGNIVYAVSEQREIHRLNEEYAKAKKRNNANIVNHMDVATSGVDIVAKSAAMKAVLADADKVAGIDTTVLLTGESGTGKDVVARYIHAGGGRSEHEMVEVNCASLPESLLEAELFGYEKGAFTGALGTGKIGLVETADNSTLFLNEINSLPLNLQAKLLRVLETKSITRIGAVKSRKVNFRLVAATNANLVESVREGTFRPDLYYRLNVIPITIPPLRERREDIAPLTRHFLDLFGEKYGIEKIFSGKVYQVMEQYDWPGNVRELKNFVERMVVMSMSSVVKINEVPDGMLLLERPTSAEDAEEPDEKTRILEALALHSGHREKTAQYLGISRRTLQYRLKKYNIV